MTAYRTTAEVQAIDNDCNEVILPVDSLVMASLCSHDDDGKRCTIILLTRNGGIDKRYITYNGAFPEMLEEEPGIIEWDELDQVEAQAQSWDIFETGGQEGHAFWELCKLDEVNKDRFDSDEEAWSFVWGSKSRVCRKALQFLYYRSPKEYRKIRQHIRDLNHTPS